MRFWGLGLVFAWVATDALAQDLVVYDDAARNDFNERFSYNGGADFAHTGTVNSGTMSIAFTGNVDSSNAIAFGRPVFADLTTASYPTLRFFVHGGTVGGQQLRLTVQRNSESSSTVVASGELDSYVTGGAIVPGAWREVLVPLAAFGVTGGFDRIDLQSDLGGGQPVLYIDDIALLAAIRANALFLDGFEGDAAAPAGTLQFTPVAPDQNVGENAGTATFTVSRVGGTFGTVGTTVVLGGTATLEDDYASSSLALSWANGDAANKTVTLTIVDDVIDEPNETVTLTLGAPTGGASLGAPSSASLTITDNDPAVSTGTLQFTPASPNQSTTETSGAITFTVSRVGGSSGVVGTTVSLGGTASPADYSNGSLVLSWGDGDASNKTVTITPVADLVDEPSESVTLQLGAPSGGATLGTPSSATLTITDAELLFAPQYTTGTIKVYRRGPSGFALLNTATLANGSRPNALAFAPDGKLWVVNEGGSGGTPASLLRYARAAVVAGGTVVAEVTISAPTPSCCLFDLAFFGDFAYVTQGDFGATDRILKYPLASLAASGAPVPTLLTNASFDVPAGLEFDPQGRLWVSNNAFFNAANTSVVRIDTTTGVADRSFTNVAVSGRNSLIRPEGLAFDALGSLWVGNNGEQTIVAYSAAQLAGAGGAVMPVHVIDASPGTQLMDGTFGGVAFDTPGALWANWQKAPFEQREYLVASANGGASYTSPLRQVLTNATTFPGFGGIAFWPVPPTLHRGGGPVAELQLERDVTVRGFVSDRFTWRDSAGDPRVAVLAQMLPPMMPGDPYVFRGGTLREYRYETPAGTRVVGPTDSGAAVAGFGYVVSHPNSNANCIAAPFSTSPLGHGFGGTTEMIARGRHHAILRFTQDYPRYCTKSPPATGYPLPVTIDWFIATGRDHPLWAITWDMRAIPVNALEDDARAPYGELLFDGSASSGAHSVIAGVGWGDRFKFTSTTVPVTLSSEWTWNMPNTVPYAKLWSATDATMGTVQTRTIDRQDAGGYFGTDRWNTTSAAGLACSIFQDPAVSYRMPCDFNWPYQIINYSFTGTNVATNNTRLAWGTNFGFLGQASYPQHGFAANRSGHPSQSYSTYVVLDRHSEAPVERQVLEVEAVHATAFTATVGTVSTQGPAGPGRADNTTLQPAGWDHVYGVWSVTANGNSVDVNFAIASGSLRNPILDVHGWTGTTLPASVTLNGAVLVQDVDYFPSILDATDVLMITLARTLAGANNRVILTR